MTFNPDIPQGLPSPAIQQPDVQTNFSQFASIFSTTSGGIKYNHTPLNSANQGKHEAIILTEQTSDPVVDGDFIDLYTKNASSALGNNLQLFLRIPQFIPNIPNTPMQLTYNQVNTTNTPMYQTFLPGGFLFYFNSISGTTASAADLTFTITLSPTPTGSIIPIAASNTVTTFGTPVVCKIAATVLNNTQFTITMDSPWQSGAAVPYNLSWMAFAIV